MNIFVYYKIFIILIIFRILYYEINFQKGKYHLNDKKKIKYNDVNKIENNKKEKHKDKEKENFNLYIYDLKINHLKEPFGIDIKGNSFSFLSKGEGPFRAYISKNGKIVQTKEVKLEESNSFYFQEPLQYNQIYKFIVEGPFSKNELEFETAIKLNAPFIKPKNKNIFSPIFVKSFKLNKNIKSGRLYITGLGLYQAYINDKKVGNAFLSPGFNDYDYYLRYQAYNITELLKEDNIIEVHMGNGWYKGRFGMNRDNEYNIFGEEYKLCAHILIEYKNRKSVNILSDKSWKVKSSKQVNNGIYDGEEVDYTLPEKSLEEVIFSKEKYNLIPDFGAQIIEKEILQPKLYISPKNEQILDFKQNMVGFVRFKGFLNKNQEIKMSHGEVLQNKNFYNKNLETAKEILKYKGDGEKRIYEPKFTYFGFRYVLVEGLEKVNPNDFEGVVIYTNLEKTIECKTDNDKINKLIENTLWGQKGNFLDVPTDCPQRDGRLGWTGDAQIFLNTACYNMDSYIFYRKFMNDLRGDQTMYYYGDIPAYSPSLKLQVNNGGAVWADAAIIIPWNLYLNYGDKNLLKEFYPMMKEYAENLINKDIEQGNQNIILRGFTYGDWLSQDSDDNLSSFGSTDHGFIMSVYYYYSIHLISLASKELGKNDDYQFFTQLKNNINNTILQYFFTKEGKLNLKKNTQTAYILSLYFKIYKNKNIIIEDLKEKIKNDLYHIKAGFTGAPLFLLVLFDNEMDDYAYRVLFNEEFPGWIYPINLGATSIWERWNSLLINGEISTSSMNSLNHYVFGTVCEAIYSRIAGLRNLSPGWKKVIIKPQLNYRIKKINFSYKSISGKYEIYWKWLDTKFNLTVIIPFGCEAEIILPNGKIYYIKHGKYNYECNINRNIFSPFSLDTPIIDIIKNIEGNKLLKELLPKIYEESIKNNEEFNAKSIRDINILSKFNYSLEIIQKCNYLLSKIKP